MKKIFVSLFVIMHIIFAASGFASAHAGKTDKYGGHYDNETGEYHYHHGYEAHEHINGICPYNHDDQTKHNSGTSVSDATPKPELHIETPDPYPAIIVTDKPTAKTENITLNSVLSIAIPILLILVFTPLGWILFGIISGLYEWIKEHRQRKKTTNSSDA